MSLLIEEMKNRLTQALFDRNMKPIELAEITKIPKSSISQYMSGYAKPKNDRIYLLAKALNVSEAWLMGYNVPMERTATEKGLPENEQPLPDSQKRILASVTDLPDEDVEKVIDYAELLKKARNP